MAAPVIVFGMLDGMIEHLFTSEQRTRLEACGQVADPVPLAAWDDPELRPVMWDSLSVAGRNGTLERRLDRRPALGAVRAKTGTTAISSALSGFVRRRFVFSVVQNGHPISSWWARKAQDGFALALAGAVK